MCDSTGFEFFLVACGVLCGVLAAFFVVSTASGLSKRRMLAAWRRDIGQWQKEAIRVARR